MVKGLRGHVFFFCKGLALPWFGSLLGNFLLSVALGSLPLEREKERKK